jgi:hypothetical protein
MKGSIGRLLSGKLPTNLARMIYGGLVKKTHQLNIIAGHSKNHLIYSSRLKE